MDFSVHYMETDHVLLDEAFKSATQSVRDDGTGATRENVFSHNSVALRFVCLCLSRFPDKRSMQNKWIAIV
jgi:hypothetical protein